MAEGQSDRTAPCGIECMIREHSQSEETMVRVSVRTNCRCVDSSQFPQLQSQCDMGKSSETIESVTDCYRGIRPSEGIPGDVFPEVPKHIFMLQVSRVTDSCSAVQSPTSATIGGSVRKRSDQSVILEEDIVRQLCGSSPIKRRCRRHCRCCDGYDCVD